MHVIHVEAESASGQARVFINEVAALDAPGRAEINLPDGGPHTLTWFVRGFPGQAFSIKITRPAAAAWSRSGSLGRSGEATGQHDIQL